MSSVLPTLTIAAALWALPAQAQFHYWNALDIGSVPKTLSATGLYANIATKVIVAGATHFEVISPLWSDDAKKKRWVLLKPNTSIQFDQNNDYWGYPDSAVFIKQFAIDTITGDSTSRRLWETRVLINKKDTIDTNATTHVIHLEDHWYGYSYRWNAAQTEAQLVGKYGDTGTVRIWPNGLAKASRIKKWWFPAKGDCENCHRMVAMDTVHGRSVLGFFTAQLNRPAPDTVGINQLEYLFKHKILAGTKPSDWNAATVPRWAALEDTTATLELRARSYIGANCSGCHGRRGTAFHAAMDFDYNYDYFDMQKQINFAYHFVHVAHGLDTVAPLYYSPLDKVNNPTGDSCQSIPVSLILPGMPQKSLILYRNLVRDTLPSTMSSAFDFKGDQMPPIGSYEVNTTFTNLLTRWINELTPKAIGLDSGINKNCGVGINTTKAAKVASAPWLQGNAFHVPANLLPSEDTQVTLMSLNGKAYSLRRLGPGVYVLPKGLPQGTYVLRVGSRRWLRQVF